MGEGVAAYRVGMLGIGGACAGAGVYVRKP